MKKIVLTIASLLFASGMALAGSDHFGSVPAAGGYSNTHSMASGHAVDMSSTKSITDSAAAATSATPAPDYGQGIWGR